MVGFSPEVVERDEHILGEYRGIWKPHFVTIAKFASTGRSNFVELHRHRTAAMLGPL